MLNSIHIPYVISYYTDKNMKMNFMMNVVLNIITIENKNKKNDENEMITNK